MKKILLTSAGLENISIKNKFLDLVMKEPSDIKALFITTAAIDTEAIIVLPKCLEDLFSCGIKEDNIMVYDMHKLISFYELQKYDVVYVCGGNTSYLVDRIKEVGFKNSIDKYLEQGGIYIGVSAGSVAASGNYIEGLNFIKNKIHVHCDKRQENQVINNLDDIYLTDDQAILILNDKTTIIE